MNKRKGYTVLYMGKIMVAIARKFPITIYGPRLDGSVHYQMSNLTIADTNPKLLQSEAQETTIILMPNLGVWEI